MAYLDDHPPARRQSISPRRDRPSGVIVVHTAENTPDWVAFDGGAEAVAKYISTRSTPGSYHDVVDSGGIVHVVEYGDEAFHDGTGTNRHSLGLSIATRADTWPLAPKGWRDGAVEQAAQSAALMARWVLLTVRVLIPARRITAQQARDGIPGFISHAELDPGRRTDPGAGFPWSQFLARFAELTKQGPKPSPIPTTGDDDQVLLITFPDPKPDAFLLTGGKLVRIKDQPAKVALAADPAVAQLPNCSPAQWRVFEAGFKVVDA